MSEVPLQARLRPEFLPERALQDGPRGTSLTRKRPPLGPCSRAMPRALRWSWEGGRFLMIEVPLCPHTSSPQKHRLIAFDATRFTARILCHYWYDPIVW